MTTRDGPIDLLIKSVVGAAFEVSNELGHGFSESLYQRALLSELQLRGIEAEREVRFHVTYKTQAIGTYIADLIVGGCLIVELKSVETLSDTHIGEVLNYLKASNLTAGLLLNFGQPKVSFRRVLRQRSH